MKAKQEQEPWVKDNVTGLQCRTCLGDDAVLQWVEDHVGGSNIILLGAGFDTRVHRLDLPVTAQLWEVDARGTQQEKLKLLDASGVRLPNRERVNYLAVDFQQESWMQRLLTSGLNAALPSLLIWEGVTMYLPEELVEQNLKTVAEEFSAPTAVYFDYIHPDRMRADGDLLKSFGEPWLFGATAEELVILLARVGLQVLDHLSTHECSQRYMPVSAVGESLGIGSPLKSLVIAGNHMCQHVLPQSAQPHNDDGSHNR